MTKNDKLTHFDDDWSILCNSYLTATNPADHYCIDPLQRLDWEEVHYLISHKKYFVLHAPRQTGKTSTLLAIADTLNQSGAYHALYVNIEAAQAVREDMDKGMTSVCQTIAARALDYGIEPTLPALAQSILKQKNTLITSPFPQTTPRCHR